MTDLLRRPLVAITAAGMIIVAQLVITAPAQAAGQGPHWPPVLSTSVECEDGNDPFKLSACTFLADFGAPVEKEVRFYAEALPGTALPRADYVPLREKLVSVRPGERGVTITVDIISDGRCEPKENFFLRLWAGDLEREEVEHEAWIVDTAC